jgi:hypothetical protein
MMTAIKGITLFVTIPATQVIALMNMFTAVAGGGTFNGAATGTGRGVVTAVMTGEDEGRVCPNRAKLQKWDTCTVTIPVDGS